MKIAILSFFLLFVINPITIPLHSEESPMEEAFRTRHEIDSLRAKIQSDSITYYADLRGLELRLNRPPIDEIMGISTGIISILGIAFIFFMFISSRNKERMAAIEKGLDSDTIKAMFSNHYRSRTPTGLGALRWGLLAIGCGAGAFIGIPDHSEPLTFVGAVVGGGIGLVVYYLIARKNEISVSKYTTPEE